MFTQPETRLTLLHLYHRWHPQIVHDVHQMGPRGARLFVPPYADPWEPNVDGALVAAAGALGSHVASRLTTAGPRGRRHRRDLRRVDAGPRLPAHARRGAPALRDGLRPPRDAGRGEAGGARAARPRLRPAHRLRPLPRALAGRHVAARATSWRRRSQASLAILEHAAPNREHWLRTALAVNRRACAPRSPFAFVVPTAASATPRRSRPARRGAPPGRGRGAAGPRRPSRRRRAPYPAGTLVVAAPAAGERLREDAARAAALPGPARARGRPAEAALRRHGPHAAAAARRRGRRRWPRPSRPTSGPSSARRPCGSVESGARRLALGHTTGDLVALGAPPRAGRERALGARAVHRRRPVLPRRHPARPRLGAASRRAARERARALGPRGLRRARARCASAGRAWASTARGCPPWTRAGRASSSRRRWGSPTGSCPTATCARGACARASTPIVLPDQAPALLLNGHAPGSMPEEYTGGLGAPEGRRRCALSSRPAGRSWPSTRPPASPSTSSGSR